MQPLLTPEELSTQVETCQVIFAIWGGQGDLVVEDDTEQAIQQLAKYLTLPLNSLGSPESVQIRDSLPSALRFALSVDPFAGSEGIDRSTGQGQRKLLLDVELPLRRATTPAAASTSAASAPAGTNAPQTQPKLSLRTAAWLSRNAQEELRRKSGLTSSSSSSSSSSAENDEDGSTRIMNAVELLSEVAVEMQEAGELGQGQEEADVKLSKSSRSDTTLGPLSTQVLRTWHHLPSLSTKSKRDDLVSYAQTTVHRPNAPSDTDAGPLTGFVLAGKPGLVVLECPLPSRPSLSSAEEQNKAMTSATSTIDSFWSRIKSESWADIPAGHKKVSETLRETFVDRAWSDMREMTGTVEMGEPAEGTVHNGGAKVWRNDLGNVEKWLQSKGVGGRLREVLGADW